MKYFVYIIRSIPSDKYYKGYLQDPFKRLAQHNAGESRYTKHFTPWELVYVQSFETKKEALLREKSLKKYSETQIKELIQSKLNELL